MATHPRAAALCIRAASSSLIAATASSARCWSRLAKRHEAEAWQSTGVGRPATAQYTSPTVFTLTTPSAPLSFKCWSMALTTACSAMTTSSGGTASGEFPCRPWPESPPLTRSPRLEPADADGIGVNCASSGDIDANTTVALSVSSTTSMPAVSRSKTGAGSVRRIIASTSLSFTIATRRARSARTAARKRWRSAWCSRTHTTSPMAKMPP
mmetsp:Transcript_46157/g.142274  ORF Transcript_46157/g.142274 Transcript_46157/m.142274 type:complete len:211 (-) Transcript_46157:855-1487(-)